MPGEKAKGKYQGPGPGGYQADSTKTCFFQSRSPKATMGNAVRPLDRQNSLSPGVGQYDGHKQEMIRR